ncbi:hypothetical protein CR513_31937, partial [Mucuna pruriens]
MLEIEKPKCVRGDRLGFRHTLVELILSIQATGEPGQMENDDRTLKELATPDVVYQSWCIQYPQLEPAQTYELKSGLSMVDRSMIDVASGRALMDKTPVAVRHLISNMASNT